MTIVSPFPKQIAFSVKTGADPHEDLHPDEEAIISPRAVEKRRREFRLGRTAAHSAIASLLGESKDPVLKGPKGEPLWPHGLVGAITHSDNIAVAAVGRRIHTEGIGLDIEPIQQEVPFEIADLVCTPSERLWTDAAPPEAGLRLKMLFSAKESIFKALYPIERIFLDFKDAELAWNGQKEAFRVRLLRRASRHHPENAALYVGCRITEGCLFTFLALPPHAGENSDVEI